MEEVVLEKGHPWIGRRLGELDLSRNATVLMIKRGNTTIKPEDEIRLRELDKIVILDRRSL